MDDREHPADEPEAEEQTGNQEDSVEKDAPAASASGTEESLEPETTDPLEGVRESLARLETAVQEGFAAAEKRERILDHLHEENQQHKRDLLYGAMTPIFKGLVRLQDDLTDLLRRAEADPYKMDRDRLLKEIALFQDEVLEILYRQGIEPFEDEPGLPFDGKRHQIIKTVPVTDPGQHARVLEVRRRGFATQDRVVRPLIVHTGKHAPPTKENKDRKENDSSTDSGDKNHG